MKSRPKHWIEYAALRAVALPVQILPHSAALTVGWALALIARPFFGAWVREARRRIRLVLGPDVPERVVCRTAWISWRNMFFTAVETLRFGGMTQARLGRIYACDEASKTLFEHSRTGRGALAAVPHMGNWDLAGIAMRLHGVPLFVIARRQQNSLVDDYATALRTAQGVDTIPRGAGTMREVIRRLRAGQQLAILPDVRMPTEGLRVPFLGGEANIGTGVGAFARHAEVPIFVFVCTRPRWNRHRIELRGMVRPDPAAEKRADVERMTRAVMDIVEKAIRSQPEQWFWFNRRWILDPLAPGAAVRTRNGPPDA